MPVSVEQYMRMGDVTVIALCITIFVLLGTSYVRRTPSFRIFSAIVGMVFLAAIVSISYHDLLARHDPDLNTLVYVLREVYYFILFDVFFLFALYTSVASNLEHHKARIAAIASSILLFAIMAADIIITAKGLGFRLTGEGTVIQGSNVFMVGYAAFVVLILALIYRIRKLLYKRVMYGFYGSVLIAVLIRFSQIAMHDSSLITVSFLVPVIAMLYILHSTPYNAAVGTLDIHAMEDMVKDLYSRKESFIFMSLLLSDFNTEGKSLPEVVQAQTRRFSVEYFRNGILFLLGNGHILMIAKKASNPDYEEWMQIILRAFDEQFQLYKFPYKIVYGESIDEISRKNAYARLIESVHRNIPDNTVHRVDADDVAGFNRGEYVLSELADIYNRHDLDDPRVLAFCQPVFNIRNGQFDTAEALMRLKLEKTGIVFPDLFIPMAEEYGYIHVLTEIILHKTCKAIRMLIDEGFQIHRISVNVSVLELKDDAFCDDISRIIDLDRVSGDKLAIELTESQTDADFAIMKEKIEELRHRGFQFYLDDFGTGYSNMERIIELPFDIIKFDRSMVIASGTDERSGLIVENMANLFNDMKFSVLFEGIEDDLAENRCMGMSASFLQGYKYSRPIPIEGLRNFLPKAV